jgi:hypothetical protein
MTSLVAVAFDSLVGRLPAGVPQGWPPQGCLRAPVPPLSGETATGIASLCAAEDGLQGTLDLEQLEPSSAYVEWFAYFEQPSLCSLASLLFQINNFHRPCTLADLDGPQPKGIVRRLSSAVSDSAGSGHLHGIVRDIEVAPHSQGWLLVGQPAWQPGSESAAPTPMRNGTARGPAAFVVFDLP